MEKEQFSKKVKEVLEKVVDDVVDEENAETVLALKQDIINSGIEYFLTVYETNPHFKELPEDLLSFAASNFFSGYYVGVVNAKDRSHS